MSTTPHVTVSRTINADPDTLWSMISDVTRVGEWSPEATEGIWKGGATGPAVGAVFAGKNRNGFRRWSTKNTVNECEPGQRFGWQTQALGLDGAQWSYTLTPADDGGTKVTHQWTDQRGGFLKALGKIATGVGDRETHNRAGMEATLAALDNAASA